MARFVLRRGFTVFDLIAVLGVMLIMGACDCAVNCRLWQVRHLLALSVI